MTMLITGGSKGIGRALATRFAREGETILVNFSRDEEAAKATASAIRDRGAQAVLLKEDVSDAAGVKRLMEATTEHVQKLDQLVHCAVYPTSSALIDLEPEDFAKAVALNASSFLYLVQASRNLLKRGSTVFCFSSIGSKLAVPRYGGLGAPKAMLEALVRYLGVELAPEGVRVNCVSAGALQTEALRKVWPDAEERFGPENPGNPTGRPLEFDDVTAMVEFLASPAAEMVNGKDIMVDGARYSSIA